MNRRRFLVISAAVLAAQARTASRHDWTGTALGAKARLSLVGSTEVQARHIFARVTHELARFEAHFSLYRDSALTRLNRDRFLAHPDPQFLGLCALAGRVHTATGGLFDPTIQPLWFAVATGTDRTAARAAIGWPRVRIATDEIRIDPGMALTFNGIAQGAAADRIAAMMHEEGLGNVLIDMGEVQALGHRPDGAAWCAQITAPDGTPLADRQLTDRALATSSPMGTRIGRGSGHILHPKGLPPRWQTVAISAPEAAVADALSTAACLMDHDAIDRAIAAFPGARLEHVS
jgi:FAD:protein FMN transferase